MDFALGCGLHLGEGPSAALASLFYPHPRTIMPRYHAISLALTAFLSLSAQGCAEPQLTCDGSDDCFMGQYCVEGLCQDDPPMVTVNNSTANNQSSNNQSGNNQPQNNTSGSNNQTTGANNQTTGANQTAGNATTPEVLACLDPPLTCANEESPEAGGSAVLVIRPEEGDPPPSRFGCVRLSDQEIVGIDRQFVGAVCASDFAGDAYSIEYNRCRDFDLLVEMTVTIDPTMCTEDEVEVGWKPDCDAATVRCEEDHDLEAGIWRFRAVIARIDTVVPSRTVPIFLESKANGTQFDYTLDVKLSKANAP